MSELELLNSINNLLFDIRQLLIFALGTLVVIAVYKLFRMFF